MSNIVARPDLAVSDSARVTSGDLCRMLEARYSCNARPPAGPKYAMAYEVMVPKVATDWYGIGTRRLDAVAVGLWPSTKYAVHGFEIKVSRADLKAELNNEDKARSEIAYCDFWWLVLSNRALIKNADEIPTGWGVLAPHGDYLIALTKAQQNAAPVHSAALVAGLMGATLRRSRLGGR